MKTIKTYDEFNFRRYGNPWVAKVDNNGKIDFSTKVGGYTGAYNKGEAGELYISNPEEGQVYAYGQKDYRGNNGGYEYTVYENGEFKRIEKTELSAYLEANREMRRMKLENENVPDYSGRKEQDMNAIETTVKHGRYAAAKWAGHPTDRAYWEARYCGIQALYSDLTDSPTAYADFNARCGVTFEAGHIVAADGTQCID